MQVHHFAHNHMFGMQLLLKDAVVFQTSCDVSQHLAAFQSCITKKSIVSCQVILRNGACSRILL